MTISSPGKPVSIRACTQQYTSTLEPYKTTFPESTSYNVPTVV